MKTWLDAATGRLTMYRMLLAALLALTAVAFALSALGQLAWAPLPLLVSLVVSVSSTVATGWLCALIFRTRAHLDSSLITGMLLFFLFLPTIAAGELLGIAAAGAIASASKYLLAIRRRHVFNPAAIGAVVVSLLQLNFAGWWVATGSLLPVVALGAFLVLYRTRRLGLGAVFVVIAATVVVVRLAASGQDLGSAIVTVFTSYPLVFLAGFMLSEPLTLPPRRWQQLTVAAAVAVLFSVPFSFGPLYGSPELALVIGNLLAFAFGQRRGVVLSLRSTTQLTPTTWEFAFAPAHPLRFTAGQYLELSLPHRGADFRGSRRIFSISSAPIKAAPIKSAPTKATPTKTAPAAAAADAAAADAAAPALVTITMRISPTPSSFKRALLALKPGAVLRATTVAGDFVLPGDESRPLVLIAGGIGITPFLSQLGQLSQLAATERGSSSSSSSRDIVVVYALSDAGELVHSDVLRAAGVRVVLAAPEPPAELPPGWHHACGERLNAETLRRLVPDIATRHAFVSGPPALVNDMRGALRALRVMRVTTDYFSGYDARDGV